MSSATLALSTIGIIIVGLAAVGLIFTLATVSLVNRWRQVGN